MKKALAVLLVLPATILFCLSFVVAATNDAGLIGGLVCVCAACGMMYAANTLWRADPPPAYAARVPVARPSDAVDLNPDKSARVVIRGGSSDSGGASCLLFLVFAVGLVGVLRIGCGASDRRQQREQRWQESDARHQQNWDRPRGADAAGGAVARG